MTTLPEIENTTVNGNQPMVKLYNSVTGLFYKKGSDFVACEETGSLLEPQQAALVKYSYRNVRVLEFVRQ